MQVNPVEEHSVQAQESESGSYSAQQLSLFSAEERDDVEIVVDRVSSVARIIGESLPMILLVIIFTVYSLYGDYVRLIFFKKDANFVFDILTGCTLAIMILEFVLQLAYKTDYLWTFYFFYDIMFPILLIFDFHFLSDTIMQKLTNQQIIYYNAFFVQFYRIMRIARILKINKILLDWQHKRQLQNNPNYTENNNMPIQLDNMSMVSDPNTAVFEKEERQHLLHSETKIAKELAERSIKKTVIIMLTLMYFIPMLQVNNYFPDIPQSQGLCFNLNNLLQQSTYTTQQLNSFLANQISQLSNTSITTNMLFFSTPFAELASYQSPEYKKLRVEDIFDTQVKFDLEAIARVRSLEVVGDGYCRAAESQEYFVKIDAGMEIGRTTFIILLVVLLACFNNWQISNMIIMPIERIIFKIKKIAKNPNYAITLINKDKKQQQENQISIVEKAILKTTSLLALVFGKAGAQIIGKNMLVNGDINFNLKGKIKDAIFGFCDIRDFTSITECLQEDVMLFVNRVACRVHDVVDEFGGFANKNIGDAFLLVWKFPTTAVSKEIEAQITDMSLMAFLVTLITIRFDQDITVFQTDSRILERMKPGFRVRLGFGLHRGWGIEGPIGSKYKLDASYLGSNVNMSARLEGATKEYDVELLLSQDFVESLSPKMQRVCRKVDLVTVGDPQHTFILYTVDINTSHMIKQEAGIYYGSLEDSESSSFFSVQEFLELNPCIHKAFRRDQQDIFYSYYEELFQAYLNGDWMVGKQLVERCLSIHPNDGPTKAMMRQMQGDLTKWKGYRIMP